MLTISEVLSLIKSIEKAEWKWHPSAEVICQIHESTSSYYYQILLEKASEGKTVRARFDLRLAKTQYRIENLAFSSCSDLASTLAKSKEELISFISQINTLPQR